MPQKKLQEDGVGGTRHEILGWIFDGVHQCIEPPAKKAAAIRREKKALRRCNQVTWRRFKQLSGKLCRALIGAPAGRGLFTSLNQALQGQQKTAQLRKNPELRRVLGGWGQLLKIIGARPTHCAQLVPRKPKRIDFCDASKAGTSGVWIGRELVRAGSPIGRQVEFLPAAQAAFAQEGNLIGATTNSDAKRAGLLLRWLALKLQVDLRHQHVAVFCGNQPTVPLVKCMASKHSRIAGRLLRALALRQMISEASPLVAVSIAGAESKTADVSSRSFGNAKSSAWSCPCGKQFLMQFSAACAPPQN